MALGVVGVARSSPGVRKALRTGEGVPDDAYGADTRPIENDFWRFYRLS